MKHPLLLLAFALSARAATPMLSAKFLQSHNQRKHGWFYTAGGRVLGVTARAANLKTAVDRAYLAASKIGFEGAYYRKDIAAKAVKK